MKEFFKLILTLESVDEILWCYHSNENSLYVLLHRAIGFSAVYKVNLKILTKFDFSHSWE